MLIKRLLDVVERRGDIGRRVAALVLPISNRPRMTSSCPHQRSQHPEARSAAPDLPASLSSEARTISLPSKVTFQILPLASSETSKPPSPEMASPTGRPKTDVSELISPVTKSSYSPVQWSLSHMNR